MNSIIKDIITTYGVDKLKLMTPAEIYNSIEQFVGCGCLDAVVDFIYELIREA